MPELFLHVVIESFFRSFKTGFYALYTCLCYIGDGINRLFCAFGNALDCFAGLLFVFLLLVLFLILDSGLSCCKTSDRYTER